jgi:photosystem II stability/assembly factor-like uncharacterized protein
MKIASGLTRMQRMITDQIRVNPQHPRLNDVSRAGASSACHKNISTMKPKSLKLNATSLKLQAALLLLCSLLTLHCSLSAQQYGWTDISGNIPDFPGDTIILNGGQDTIIAGFRSICFLDDDEGWISTQVFDSGVVLHTMNGGDSWEIQELQFPELIIAIDMKDSQQGYAASEEGTIFHTNNGGENWEYHGSTFALLLYDMDFPPGSDTGYTCGMNGAIFRITPGGVESMVSGIVSDMKSIFFLSPDHGWVCGQSVLKEYVDGTWVAGHSYASGIWNDVFFVDEMNGWGAGHWLSFPLDTIGVLHTSNDAEWITQPLSLDNHGDISQVFFLDNQHGWAIQFFGKIFATEDGGNSWYEQSPGINDELLTNIQMTSLTNGYICGNNRTLLKYTHISGEEETGGQGARGKVELWPNPTHGKFQITNSISQTNSKLQIQNIEVVDLYGKVVDLYGKVVEDIFCDFEFGACLELGAWDLEFDIARCPAGIYFIRIHLENQTIVKKIIKI